MRVPRRPLLDPRHRFRDRLLAGMVLVALLPLAAFGLLVAADLGGITNSTVDEAHRTIRADLENRQQSAVADHAGLADATLSAIDDEVRLLRDQMTRALAATPPTTALPPDLVVAGDATYSARGPDGPSTLLLRTSTEAAAAQPAAAAESLTATMAAFRRTHPATEAAWVLRRSAGMLYSVPGFDVAAALASRRLAPASLQDRGAVDVFSASQARTVSGDETSSDWVAPGGTPSSLGPYWTDAYPGMEDGSPTLTAWMPLADGDTYVGVDLPLARVSDDILAAPVTSSASDTLLLSSSGMVLGGEGNFARDFDLPAQPGGAFLPAPSGRGFAAGLAAAERTGRFTVLQVSLGGTASEFIAAPVYSAHWLLASAVPVSTFEPDLAALTRGIDSGIHGLYLGALPVLALLLLLAFLLATVLSRRLVLPVRALTAAAGRLAGGHTDEEVPPQGSDEVGVLAASLERMRRDINSSRDALLAASRELEERVATRTRELRARNEELVALNDLAGSLTRSLDRDEIIRDALEALAAVLPVQASRGYLVEAGRLVVAREAGQPGALDRPLGTAAADAAHDRLLVDRPEGADRLLAVPLVGGEDVLGVLAAMVPRRRIAARTLGLCQAIGDQVGLALRTAELAEASQKTAVLSERARLAREIHDTLAQQLTAVVLQLEAAQGLVHRDGGRAEAALQTAREMARSALQEARRSVWDLRPTPLAATGVVAALESEVDAWRERTGIAVTFQAERLERPLSLRPTAEVGLLRILQEALTNIRRHATGVDQVRVLLERAGDRVRLTVTDDGAGFVPDEPREGSFGLVGMTERARLAGGQMSVRSAPGGGTTLVVDVPLGDTVAVPV